MKAMQAFQLVEQLLYKDAELQFLSSGMQCSKTLKMKKKVCNWWENEKKKREKEPDQNLGQDVLFTSNLAKICRKHQLILPPKYVPRLIDPVALPKLT